MGSREVGIDPLASLFDDFEGFENIPYSETQIFPSESVAGGFVQWQRVNTIGKTVQWTYQKPLFQPDRHVFGNS